MLYWIESKTSGKGFDHEGDFDSACHTACAECTTDSSVWCVWDGKHKIAECTLRGVSWVHRGIRDNMALNFPLPDQLTR